MYAELCHILFWRLENQMCICIIVWIQYKERYIEILKCEEFEDKICRIGIGIISCEVDYATMMPMWMPDL